MSDQKAPFSIHEYGRMAEVLEIMSGNIRQGPAMDHHFAERLATLAQEMRDDCSRVHPNA